MDARAYEVQFLQSSSVFGNGPVAWSWLLHSSNSQALDTFVVAQTRHGWAFGGLKELYLLMDDATWFGNHDHTFALEKMQAVVQGQEPAAAAWVEMGAGSNSSFHPDAGLLSAHDPQKNLIGHGPLFHILFLWRLLTRSGTLT